MMCLNVWLYHLSWGAIPVPMFKITRTFSAPPNLTSEQGQCKYLYETWMLSHSERSTPWSVPLEVDFPAFMQDSLVASTRWSHESLPFLLPLGFIEVWGFSAWFMTANFSRLCLLDVTFLSMYPFCRPWEAEEQEAKEGDDFRSTAGGWDKGGGAAKASRDCWRAGRVLPMAYTV